MSDLLEVERRVITSAKRTVIITANDVIARAIPLTPLEYGGLRASGRAEVVEDTGRTFRMEASFNEPYAAAQHAGFWVTGPNAGVHIKRYTTPGTGPGYLEVPFKSMLPRYRSAIANSVKLGIEGRI